MNEKTIELAITGIEAVIAEAPQVEALLVKGKEFIAEMFTGALITIDQQNTLNARLDKKQDEALNGTGPDELKVEPDPV